MENTTKQESVKAPTAPAPVEAQVSQEYFFPTYGVTITATSKEEAEIKLNESLKTNSK